MSQYANSTAADTDPIPYAWIEAIDEDYLFIGTEACIAGFRRQDLPPRWGDLFKAPVGNLILAQQIDCHGSSAETPLDRVTRLDWPLAGDSVRKGQALGSRDSPRH